MKTLICEQLKTKGNKKLISDAVGVGWVNRGKVKGADNQFYTNLEKYVFREEIEQERAVFKQLI